MRYPQRRPAGDGDASHASAVLSAVDLRRVRAPARQLPGTDHEGRLRRVACTAIALPAVCLAGDPWAHRALIVRRLLGLERVIGLSLVDPIRDERGWRFPAATGGVDPVSGARFVSDLYLTTDPGYRGRFTVPFVWDTRSQRIVENDFQQITVTFETEFRGYHRPGAPDLYPVPQRAEIDALSTLIYHAVNNGVYKAGLATSQAAYEEAFDALFSTLSALEERLTRRRFLLGSNITEADVRLYPDIGPVRRRLSHPLQVQPEPAGGLPGAVGLRAGPLPAAGLR